jgi:3-methyladenine DNA glycosylase AlkC
MVEKREPKKGQGVPKESPELNSISDLQGILAERLPQGNWSRLPEELNRRKFFEAGMQQQVRILAEASATLLGEQYSTADLIPALAASPAEKVRGVAAFTVPLASPDDLAAQLEGLYSTGALRGTWPRELSATVLHNLIIEHGVSTVLPRAQDWIKDPDPAIRRLVIESFRPRGVMLAHIAELKQDPSPLKTLLEPLLDDGADYVRKAVANNLNDISRDNPDVALAWAREWMIPHASPERHWILSRALRTLVKQGDRAALEILGYSPAADLTLIWHDTTPEIVEINQFLPFEFELINPTQAEAMVILLLTIDAPGKGKGRRTSRYQIWKGKIQARASRQIEKRIHFVDKSTQRKEPGTYRLIVTLNGQVVGERTMTLER